MRKNLSSKIVVVFKIPLVLVASSVALYSFADVEKGVNEEELSESDERQTAVQFIHHENRGEKDES